MMLVDVHAHMDLPEFRDDADHVVEECEKAGVKIIVCNAVDAESNRKVLELVSRHKILRAALGIYPTHCLEMIEEGRQGEFDDELRFIEGQIAAKRAVAVGEVGLEYSEVKSLNERKKQIMKGCLEKFCDIAKKHHVPIIMHSRGAELELIEFLENIGMKDEKVIMHCFSGRRHLIKRIRDNGWFFSIPCTILKLEHFQSIVKDAPLERIFTETDAPYLSPVRGRKNDSRNVKLIVDKIAELKGMDPEEVANIIYNNYQRVFI